MPEPPCRAHAGIGQTAKPPSNPTAAMAPFGDTVTEVTGASGVVHDRIADWWRRSQSVTVPCSRRQVAQAQPPHRASTVWQILKDAGIDPAPRRGGPTRKQVLIAQARTVITTDFFHVDTVLLKHLICAGSSSTAPGAST